MIINGSFYRWNHGIPYRSERGWHWFRHPREGDPPGDQGIKLPVGWKWVRYADETVTNPYYDGRDSSLFAKPEIDVKEWGQLPEKDRFLTQGFFSVLKPYKAGRALLVEMVQEQVLEPAVCQLTLRVFPDAVAGYDGDRKIWATDRAAFVRFILGGKRYGWVDITPEAPDHNEYRTLSLTFLASGDKVQYGFGLMGPWGLTHGTNFFLTGLTLEKLGELPDWAPPARDYLKKYHLIVPGLPWSKVEPVFKKVWAQQSSAGPAFDDAGIGPKEREIVAWGFEEGKRPEVREFFDRDYPGATLRFRDLPNGDHPPPPPPPPVLPEIVTFHAQDRIPGLLALSTEIQRARAEGLTVSRTSLFWRAFGALFKKWAAFWAWQQTLGYVSAVRPGWMKLFTAEQAQEVVNASNGETMVDWRPFFSTYDEFFYPGGAVAYVDAFRDTLIAQAPYIAAVEGSNERVGTGTRETNQKVFAFELELARHLDSLGLGVKAAGPNIAIANLEPGEELEDARALLEYYSEHGHYWTEHMYKPVTPTRDWTSEAKWFEERVFMRAEQVAAWGFPFPRVLGTEAGLCAAIEDEQGKFGGFLSTEGWRSDRCSAGTLDEKRQRCIAYTLSQRRRILQMSAETGVIVEALMLFTVNRKWMGWSKFRYESADIAAFQAALLPLQMT